MTPIVYSLKVTCAPCRMTESKEQDNHRPLLYHPVVGYGGVREDMSVKYWFMPEPNGASGVPLLSFVK